MEGHPQDFGRSLDDASLITSGTGHLSLQAGTDSSGVAVGSSHQSGHAACSTGHSYVGVVSCSFIH